MKQVRRARISTVFQFYRGICPGRWLCLPIFKFQAYPVSDLCRFPRLQTDPMGLIRPSVVIRIRVTFCRGWEMVEMSLSARLTSRRVNVERVAIAKRFSGKPVR